MPYDITTPESKQSVTIRSFSKKELRELRAEVAEKPDMPSEDYWQHVIEKNGANFTITEDTLGADLAYVGKAIMGYSTGGPEAVKNL